MWDTLAMLLYGNYQMLGHLQQSAQFLRLNKPVVENLIKKLFCCGHFGMESAPHPLGRWPQ